MHTLRHDTTPFPYTAQWVHVTQGNIILRTSGTITLRSLNTSLTTLLYSRQQSRPLTGLFEREGGDAYVCACYGKALHSHLMWMMGRRAYAHACVCVCVCVRACACMCACARMHVRACEELNIMTIHYFWGFNVYLMYTLLLVLSSAVSSPQCQWVTVL